jgi:hypothetical protein
MKKLGLFMVIIWLLAIIGEIRCVYKAVTCNWEPVGKAEVIYTVAACTGLGVVVGYINIEDK